MKISRLIVVFLTFLCTQAEAGKVLLLRTQTAEMDLLKATLVTDLKKHRVFDVVITKDTKVESIIEVMRKGKPDLIALLDNRAVSLMKKIHQSGDKDLMRIPGAATMALNLRTILKDSDNICGIAYEVPAFTIITRFRAITGLPVRRVLAPYRKSEFESSFQEAKEQLAHEGIELIGVNAEARGDSLKDINAAVEAALQENVRGKKIDAILIPTDNILLNKEAFTTIWLKKSQQLKVPFLCNIEKFVAPDFGLCSFAAYPDLNDLGHQFSEQIVEILENGAKAKELEVDYIVSAKESLNGGKAKALGLPLKEERLSGVQIQ